MKELERLPDQAFDSLATELVRQARAEEPPPVALSRLAAALGVGNAVELPLVGGTGSAGAAPVARTAKWGLSKVTSRWLLPSGLSAIIAVGVVLGMKGRLNGSKQSMQSQTAAMPPLIQSQTAAMPPNGKLTVNGSPLSSAADAPKVGGRSDVVSLAPELMMLDSARVLIEARNPGAALELLDAYDAEFPTGTLIPEARVIRVQALIQSGQRSAAVQLGTEFLSAAPASPHAHRIRQLLGPKPGVARSE